MRVKKIVYLSILLSLATILGYVESFIPTIGIPGVKIGLANIVVLLTIYNFKVYESFIVMILRVVLVSLILGTFLNTGFFMSLSGGICSFIVMSLLKRIKKFSIIGVSIAGALSHSIGQIVIAMIIMDTSLIIYYVPWVMLFSIPTGVLVGFISSRLAKLNLFQSQKN